MQIENFDEKVPKKVVENTKTSRVLRQALDPCQYCLTLLTQLHFAMSAKSWKNVLDQILDPLLDRQLVRFLNDV